MPTIGNDHSHHVLLILEHSLQPIPWPVSPLFCIVSPSPYLPQHAFRIINPPPLNASFISSLSSFNTAARHLSTLTQISPMPTYMQPHLVPGLNQDAFSASSGTQASIHEYTSRLSVMSVPTGGSERAFWDVNQQQATRLIAQQAAISSKYVSFFQIYTKERPIARPAPRPAVVVVSLLSLHRNRLTHVSAVSQMAMPPNEGTTMLQALPPLCIQCTLRQHLLLNLSLPRSRLLHVVIKSITLLSLPINRVIILVQKNRPPSLTSSFKKRPEKYNNQGSSSRSNNIFKPLAMAQHLHPVFRSPCSLRLAMRTSLIVHHPCLHRSEKRTGTTPKPRPRKEYNPLNR
jgi:hypothetical protein